MKTSLVTHLVKVVGCGCCDAFAEEGRVVVFPGDDYGQQEERSGRLRINSSGMDGPFVADSAGLGL
jgi:hypothetical protein